MIRVTKGLYHLLIAILSLFWFRFPGRKLIIIGVTGTDGKTTTSSLVYEILRKAGKKVSMITSVHAVVAGKTYDTGFHVTTPNSFYIQKYLREAVNHGDRYMVLEVTSHAISQYRVFGLRFAVAILTNVTREHLDWHGTYDKYLKTKITLLRHSNVSILNRDEAYVYNKAKSILKNNQIITYGMHRTAEYRPNKFNFKTSLPGIFNLYNCLAAATCADALGINLKFIQSAISEFRGVSGRMEVIAEKPFKVIIDFAHTPNALEQALKTVRKDTAGNLIHVFGSAGLRDVTKRPLMGEASAKYADLIVLTEEDYRTENAEAIADALASGIKDQSKVYRNMNRHDAIEYAISKAKSGDTVIITGKGHEKSLCRGRIEYPWSDQDTAKKLLQRLSNNAN